MLSLVRDRRENRGYFQVALSNSVVVASQVIVVLLAVIAWMPCGYFQVALSNSVVVLSQVIVLLQSAFGRGSRSRFGSDYFQVALSNIVMFPFICATDHRFGDGYFQVALSNSVIVLSQVIVSLLCSLAAGMAMVTSRWRCRTR
ncbi:MAG: hypothetical protein U0031_12175 [Thermomicrobiales bacterium]